ncbi:TPA: hypothetical protein LA742_000391 [Clostridium botulinum]|uniref:hypothetical protein n=1 Tax=Clostridium TaxID=1485 RepID=UPI000774BA70|nr:MULTISPECIES: hypothetical protein [Clostridium]AUM94732.1 hypothetical protein RSJ11_06020 [Clostridium sporogenes]AVQ52169.1 hypothetical protein C7M59_04565 [Clostridium botulinum]HBJ2611981.1 hypothetical protein [Clostridium botulinum]
MLKVCKNCANNVNNQHSNEGKISCFNCDECYYYGLDDNNLSKNVKFEYYNFQIPNCKAGEIDINLV